jgi:phosphohistidine phosphatase
MKTLYLLRHAHAAPKELSFSDFDRPLDERGREEAEAVAEFLKGKNITFDYVMCSGALRTQETLEPLRSVVGTNAIEISENFYNSPEDQILKHIRHVSDERSKILYIGHNPGIAFAAIKFAKVFPDVLMEGITPATLIGFQFPIEKWEELDWREGEIMDVYQPTLSPTESPSPKES